MNPGMYHYRKEKGMCGTKPFDPVLYKRFEELLP